MRVIDHDAYLTAQSKRFEADKRFKQFGIAAMLFVLFLVGLQSVAVEGARPKIGGFTYWVLFFLALALINALADKLIYRYAIRRAEKPYEHCLSMPYQVASTKAQTLGFGVVTSDGKRHPEWERRIFAWADENLQGKSIVRSDEREYRFYFELLEDYALFKLWV